MVFVVLNTKFVRELCSNAQHNQATGPIVLLAPTHPQDGSARNPVADLHSKKCIYTYLDIGSISTFIMSNNIMALLRGVKQNGTHSMLLFSWCTVRLSR